MSERQSMIEEIVVRAKRSGEIRLKDDKPPPRTQHPVNFSKTSGNVFARLEMLIHVAGEHRIHGSRAYASQISARSFQAAHARRRETVQDLSIDIDSDFFRRVNLIDEMAISSAHVERRSILRNVALDEGANGTPE